ncbi:MAG: hypothetical protein WBO32_03090, partial [Cyclobacteriaceae bacterium]
MEYLVLGNKEEIMQQNRQINEETAGANEIKEPAFQLTPLVHESFLCFQTERSKSAPRGNSLGRI